MILNPSFPDLQKQRSRYQENLLGLSLSNAAETLAGQRQYPPPLMARILLHPAMRDFFFSSATPAGTLDSGRLTSQE